MSSAICWNWNASSFTHYKSLWAFQTYLIIPIPCFTAEIKWYLIVELWEDADSISQVISFIATGTASGCVECRAVIRNGDAPSCTQKPSERTFEADLVVPIPCFAPKVSWWVQVAFWEDTPSVNNFIALVAANTETFVIEVRTVIRNFQASSRA